MNSQASLAESQALAESQGSPRDEEVRLTYDGKYYTKQEFLVQYGEERGAEIWEEAGRPREQQGLYVDYHAEPVKAAPPPQVKAVPVKAAAVPQVMDLWHVKAARDNAQAALPESQALAESQGSARDEVRLAYDTKYYTKQQFLVQYGAERGAEIWEEAGREPQRLYVDYGVDWVAWPWMRGFHHNDHHEAVLHKHIHAATAKTEPVPLAPSASSQGKQMIIEAPAPPPGTQGSLIPGGRIALSKSHVKKNPPALFIGKAACTESRRLRTWCESAMTANRYGPGGVNKVRMTNGTFNWQCWVAAMHEKSQDLLFGDAEGILEFNFLLLLNRHDFPPDGIVFEFLRTDWMSVYIHVREDGKIHDFLYLQWDDYQFLGPPRAVDHAQTLQD